MSKKRGATYENLTKTEKIELRNHLEEIKEKIINGLPRTALDNVDAGLALIGGVIQSEVNDSGVRQSNTPGLDDYESRW